ncbi:MAG TPA: LacI family DNA-binding transcriptional regulator [Roseiflexaceae bacterium]|nr:LacI family DNA-binding transcriptional regulator [Roseiflexaceae bacterium]
MANATQEDVARLAGVSRATVSYVLNGQSGGKVRISDETRQRVLAAIEQLGYQPDAAARSLRTGRTQLLAVMVPDLTNPFYPLLIRGAQQRAEEHGYEILVYDTNDRAVREEAFVNTMLRRRVDGVILVSFHLDIRAAAAAAEAIRHLIERGHRRIAHLAGPYDTPPGKVRLQGYREALEAAAIDYDEQLVRYGSFQREGVADLALQLLQVAAPPPTAIFAANDVMAIEVIRTLTHRGVRIPEDVAVVGFDNIPEADLVVPSLTTVGQDAQALGEQAAALLLERLAGEDAAELRHISMPFRLIIRESA